MFHEKTHLGSARIGLVALALTVAGAIAITGAVPSPASARERRQLRRWQLRRRQLRWWRLRRRRKWRRHGWWWQWFRPRGGAGGGSSGEGPLNCNTKKGWTYSPKKDMCVHTGLLDDKELYQSGRVLAVAGRYEDALITLGAIRDQHDAMVLTMIGYSERKLGNVDKGMALYQKALAIEPDNANTHEYLGEGYVAIGKLELAKLELDKLAQICGTSCEQYEDLAKAISGEAEE